MRGRCGRRLTEPGDGVAGALVAAHGAAAALRASRSVTAVRGRGHAGRPPRGADGRWIPRAPDAVYALSAAHRARVRPVTPERRAVAAATRRPRRPRAAVPVGARRSGGDRSPAARARDRRCARGDVATASTSRRSSPRSWPGIGVTDRLGRRVRHRRHGAPRVRSRRRERPSAWLAGGVDRAYPAGHRDLLDRIVGAGGAVVTEVPCGAAPTKWRFLARNRLIAAAADATVVVEAGWRSGSLNTAGHAATLGRPLGAVPGSRHQRRVGGMPSPAARVRRALRDERPTTCASCSGSIAPRCCSPVGHTDDLTRVLRCAELARSTAMRPIWPGGPEWRRTTCSRCSGCSSWTAA